MFELWCIHKSVHLVLDKRPRYLILFASMKTEGREQLFLIYIVCAIRSKSVILENLKLAYELSDGVDDEVT